MVSVALTYFPDSPQSNSPPARHTAAVCGRGPASADTILNVILTQPNILATRGTTPR